MFNANLLKLSSLAILLVGAVACEEVATVSVSAEQQEFLQSTTVNNKVDILWVIDNSGSMHDSQTLVANNFNAFINSFVTKNYDFQMAVTTTDAYNVGKRSYRANGGEAILTQNTVDLETKFMANIMAGTWGSANEKGMASLVSALTYQPNLDLGFPRADAFFAVIIVSDENDSSAADPGLSVAETYIQDLDAMFSNGTTKISYSISAIVMLPGNAGCTSGTVGLHYVDATNLTNGVLADICDTNFAASLNTITTNIVELSTQFYLDREPIIESIVVKVNGVIVPQSDTNGWSYVAETNSILFHGSAVPPQGASISVDFDPTGLIN